MEEIAISVSQNTMDWPRMTHQGVSRVTVTLEAHMIIIATYLLGNVSVDQMLKEDNVMTFRMAILSVD